jgi:hypothetical protein
MVFRLAVAAESGTQFADTTTIYVTTELEQRIRLMEQFVNQSQQVRPPACINTRDLFSAQQTLRSPSHFLMILKAMTQRRLNSL